MQRNDKIQLVLTLINLLWAVPRKIADFLPITAT